MQVLMSLYIAVLFVVLTPGIFLSLPKGGSKLTVAVVHGLVFALVYYFTYNSVSRLAGELEGFKGYAQRECCECPKKGGSPIKAKW